MLDSFGLLFLGWLCGMCDFVIGITFGDSYFCKLIGLRDSRSIVCDLLSNCN